MKKKPALQAVLDDIGNFSEERIEALSGPHFPRWIKDELLELRKRNGRYADDVAIDIAAQMNEYAKKQLNKAVDKE